MSLPSSDILLAIPGPWPDRVHVLTSILDANDQQVLVGGPLLIDKMTKHVATLDVEPRRDTLASDMQAGSGRAFDAATLAGISGHVVLPILGFEADDALPERLSRFTAAMRHAGGLGVIALHSGVAHPWERWGALMDAGDPHSLYRALIVHVLIEDDTLSSFGMKQFGLPDAAVPPDDGGGEAAETLQIFNVYQCVERPTLESGQTFSIGPEAPRFTLVHVTDTRYEPGHHYLNPYGLWQLSWADDED